MCVFFGILVVDLLPDAVSHIELLILALQSVSFLWVNVQEMGDNFVLQRL